MNTIAKSGKRLSVKAQALAALIAVIAAVALPQILHLLGAASGLGSSLGEIFLPMHLPIMLVGLMAGPFAGAAAGLVAPLLSSLMTSMPAAGILPFMMIELCVYGLAAGALRSVKIPTVLKVLVTQIAGRAVRAGAICLAVYAFGYDKVGVAIIWTSIAMGLIGIALQLVIIPLIMYRLDGIKE
ncbi:MAG: ECF transporter S component [Oscillospiraceae bacterium]|nr:ECF transporter S component [Oscillospiraceae bacterium]